MIERIPVLILLLVLSVIDIKKREVPHWGVLALFLYSLFTVDRLSASLFWGIYAFLGLWFIFFITKGGMGGGDVKLLTVLAFYLGSLLPVYLGFLVITSGFGFLISILYYRKLNLTLPLVPFICLAFSLFSLLPIFMFR